MKGLPYFCWYPADFDVDENVKLMDLEQIGLYALCLNHAWINGSLPADTEEIRRAMKVPRAQFTRAWARVSKCFITHPEEQGRLVNSRQEKERKMAQAKSDAAREAGVRSGEARRNGRLNASEQMLNERSTRAADSASDSAVSLGSAEGDIFEQRFLDELERCGVALRQAKADFRQRIVDIARKNDAGRSAQLFSKLMRQERFRGKSEGYVIAAFSREVAI